METIILSLVVFVVLLLHFRSKHQTTKSKLSDVRGSNEISFNVELQLQEIPTHDEYILPISQQPLDKYIARMNPQGPVFAVRYTDRFGRSSERVLTPTIINSDDSFTAYCYFRDDSRTFRTDRVSGFFDPETGECFENFDQACDMGIKISDRWKAKRRERRKAGERLGVRR